MGGCVRSRLGMLRCDSLKLGLCAITVWGMLGCDYDFFVRIRITRIKGFTGCYLIIVGENLGMILFILIWLTSRYAIRQLQH
jgi:hypothetical protein